MKRTDYCGNINEKYIDKTIIVNGWVHKTRDIGNLLFIDLRDREGIVQVVVENDYKAFEYAKSIRTEFVIEVEGKVRKRENPNKKIKTGMIEIVANKINILNKAEELPFFPSEKKEISEETRLKYRYIDLRKDKIKNNIALRHKAALNIRNFLNDNDFYEIETPILIKSTPEGARDFLVPSRVHHGKFYALPQSPQLFKQILMISGFDRYFQLAKCFRDEDLRSDRQPEFTQVDIEMSFVDEKDVMELSEKMLKNLFKIIGVDVSTPFLKLSYDEAMKRYATDKPDLRIKEEIEDWTEILGKTSSNILSSIYQNNGNIRGIKFQNAKDFSRKVVDNLNNELREMGGKGAFWIKKIEGIIKSSVKLTDDELSSFEKASSIKENEIYLFVGGIDKEINPYLDYIRKKFGDIREGFKFLWVIDFPLFERDSEGNITSLHHPFTSPKPEDIDKLSINPVKVYSNAYDIVLNGYEIGGGSIRIHDFELQKKIFEVLGLSDDDINKKFGFFIKALKTGTPPHGGIAFGLDRILMLMAGETSIREVIPFPKTTSGMDLMSETPSEVDEKQLTELKINILK
jgi:aspartyl-tRNA synthetase